ncbi:MAG: hypothetical protein NT049_09480 [Planctomycetota bacterium]|nr:hypothetical protein [Planctomycetota bacterium]
MNRLAPDNPRSPTPQATPAGPILAQIETLLQEQWQQVRQGNINAAYDLGKRVDVLVPRAAGTEENAADAETRQRIGRLCSMIELALAQKVAETAARRDHLRASRIARKAYGRG